ncbi:MAG TPA: ABC transporter permease subunit/CPBP intramembrane protease [Planctomycetaceae bacterium]|jgi:sodium transport system permease protein|nr:ABC transporter permease subunit/CPBP intramembrane protease [Planctomycetaceae bacterium]
MNRKNVRLVFLREVRDQIRDRRTLFMIVVLPLLLYPGLAIGMVQISFLFKEQPRTIVLLGTENLPADPRLLSDSHFASQWFPVPDDADKLHVIHDGVRNAADVSPQDKADAEANAGLLEEGRELAGKSQQLEELEKKQDAARKDHNDAEEQRLGDEIRSLKEELAERFSASKIQVLIVAPQGLKEEVERINRSLAARGTDARPDASEAGRVRLLVVQNSADEKSSFAYQRVRLVLTAWEQRMLQERLSEAKLPATLAKPVDPELLDVAIARQVSASLWSKLFPTLLIIMAVTGAFYPAVDVAAGEKERGTMETLLISPARRSEIVLGKFFTVVTFSISTVLLNLLSMGITGKYLISLARNEALTRMGADSLSFPGPWEMMWLILLLLPLSAFYSAISLALATFARSTKEGQYYLTPILLVTLGLTMFCLSPVVEIDPFYSILPVVGPALLLKEVLASPGSSAPLVYGIPVLATSIAYSLAGLWWAITMFNREDVLFREAERFDVRLWIRHLLRDKESMPSFLEGGLCFVLLILLQFVAFRFLQSGVVVSDGHIDPGSTLRLLLIQQMVFVGSPALFMGIMLTTSVWRTFRLRLPNWRYLMVGCVLPLAVGPLSVALQNWLQGWFFPPLPKPVEDLMRSLGEQTLPLWFVLLAMAVAPGICEELAFRGFILSGFVRSARPAVAIGLSAIAFGVFHIIPQQVFNATLMGLILGLLAIRSGSLLPGVLFHIIYNSIETVRVRAGDSVVQMPVLKWFLASEPSAVGYNTLALVVAGVVATLLIAWLIFHGQKAKTVPETPDEAGSDESIGRPRKAEPAIATKSMN